MSKLVWIVADLTTGKFDGFYESEEMAIAAMDDWEELLPSHDLVVAKSVRWNSKLFLSDDVWLGSPKNMN